MHQLDCVAGECNILFGCQIPIETCINDQTEQTYSYDFLADPGDMGQPISQANAEGAKGYRFNGQFLLGNLYRKSNSLSNVTYTYMTDEVPGRKGDF